MLRILVAGTIDREGLNLLEARDDIEYKILEQPDSTTIENHVCEADALYTALTDGTLHGAGLDVFANEPPAEDNPLFSLDNVIFTPHNAAMSQESLKATSRACIQNALDALDGKLNYNNVVNKDVL